jgi:putative Mg2+ transporter-C (MgtC) family protein
MDELPMDLEDMFGWMDWDWFWPMNTDWGQLTLGQLTLRLAAATVLGGMIGLERERLDRAAGLRTHALVSVGSALFMVISIFGFPAPPGGEVALDPSRIAAQIVSGIGFLGAGIIIFRDNTVRGLTTAATIWAVAGIGMAAGGGLYAAAILGTAFMLLIQAGFKPLERAIFPRKARQHRVVLDIDHGHDVLAGIQFATRETPVQLRSLHFDSTSSEGIDAVELTLMADNQQDILDLVARLRQVESVRHITYKRGSSIIRKRERAIATEDDDEDDESGNGRR